MAWRKTRCRWRGVFSTFPHHDILRDSDISWLSSAECGKGYHFLIRIPHSPFPIPHQAVNEAGGGAVLSMPWPGPCCGALIVSGLCGGARNLYNGFSHFVASC